MRTARFRWPPLDVTTGRSRSSSEQVPGGEVVGHMSVIGRGYVPIRVPTRTEKPEKMGRHFPVREFWTDWKSQGKSHYMLENSENFKCYFLFLVIFIWTVYYFQKWIRFSVKENKTLKKYWKMEKKILEKSGNFVRPEKRETCQCIVGNGHMQTSSPPHPHLQTE